MLAWLIAAGCVAGWVVTTRLVQARFDEIYLDHTSRESYHSSRCFCQKPPECLLYSGMIALAFPVVLVGLMFLSRPTKPVRLAQQAERDAAELKSLREIARREGLPL